MEELSDRVVIDPEVLVGKPIIKGTRIPVQLIIELLANGRSEKQILKEYSQLKEGDIKAALLYASNCLKQR